MLPAMTEPQTLSPTPARKNTELRRFVRARFGLRGTWDLHRAALGFDILRAPVNLILAPLFVVMKLAGVALRGVGARRVGGWMLSRDIFLQTAVSRRVAGDVEALLKQLVPDAPETVRDRAIADYVSTRGAVAEIATMLVFLTLGWGAFHMATPGVVSLVGPVAELRAFQQAVEAFPLGRTLGQAWYTVFPARFGVADLFLTGAVLAVAASLVTTFAGLIADPVQVVTGSHRRRLVRLVARIETARPGAGLEREHIAARVGDITDTLVTLWRSFR